MTTKKRFHRWQAGMPKPDLPDDTLIEARQHGYVRVAGAVQHFNWGDRSPLTGWRRVATPVRRRKPAPKQEELPITSAPEQQAPAVHADEYLYGKDTSIVMGYHAGKSCVVAEVGKDKLPLFSWAFSGLQCCGMKELRGQYMCYTNGALAYDFMGYHDARKNWQFVLSEWHPGAIKRMIDLFTTHVLTGTGACIAIFNSIDGNRNMNQRTLYDLLLADPLKRCVPLPPTRNAVHNSLLYPMMIYATFNLPDTYASSGGGTTYDWGPTNVQIKAPLLSKTGASEYVQ